MTPMAHRIARFTSDPKYKTAYEHQGGTSYKHLNEYLYDCHFFEVTACIPFAAQMAWELSKMMPDEIEDIMAERMFLPAPKCWIELSSMDSHGPMRYAFYAAQSSEDGPVTVEALTVFKIGEFYDTVVVPMGKFQQLTVGPTYFGDLIKTLIDRVVFTRDTDQALFNQTMMTSAKLFLYLINNPVIAGRTTHPPHKGLMKELRNTWGGKGFPLHGWTEVTIDVTKTAPIGTKTEVEGTFTGRRPLHFVRKFMRIRRGQTEYVKAHYRGDPSIGIKQTRYNAVASHRR